MNDFTIPAPVNPSQRVAEIKERMQEMQDTLEGCDWCCGGGEEEWADLVDELKQLGEDVQ
jgi:hypothetical protein